MRRALVLAIALGGCSGTTGSGLVRFTARAGGPAEAGGGALEFNTGSGYHVSLTRADFHIGAVYLNMSAPSSGGPEEPCTLPGIYVGEAFGACDATGRCGIDLDLLSPELVAFPLPGEGTANPAMEAEIWLTGRSGAAGGINATDDPTPILVAAGTASRGASEWPFSATVTIGANRQKAVGNPALPGAAPICLQRIVTPIPVSFTLSNGGTLNVRVDPREMFNGIEFSMLPPPDDHGTHAIPDELSDVVGAALFGGVTGTASYQVTFTPKP